MGMHMIIELDEADEAQLRALAEHENLSPEDVVKKALAERLAYDRWFRAAVREGRASAARGELYDHEEVFADIYARMNNASAAASE